MTEINLLPWRELKREREKKEFTTYIAGILIVMVLLVFVVNRTIVGKIETQTSRNNRLETEIAEYNKQIVAIKNLKTQRKNLIARMMIVQNLQATRILTVRLFDELINILPDGVYVTHMDRVGDKVTLLGYTESNSNISQMMRKIESSKWIQRPELTEIKKSKEKQDSATSAFKLSFILKPKVMPD